MCKCYGTNAFNDQYIFEEPVPGDSLLKAVRTIAYARRLHPPSPLSYVHLIESVYKNMVETQKIEQMILTKIKDAFEIALSRQLVMITRPERARLFKQILTKILNDLSNNSQ